VGELLVLAFAILVVAALVALASLTVVKPYESIVTFRLGKATADSVRGPGLHFILPVVDRAVHVSMLETATDGTVRGTAKDDVALAAELRILWRVVDPLKSVLNVANVEEALKEVAGTGLEDLAADEAIDYPGRAADAIEARLNDVGKRWGIAIAKVTVRRVSRG
jgi:regulator of protease activity HflC (stomatin/prohibitin superfamily)